MFDQRQKTTAVLFARKLAARDYKAALELCSEELKAGLSARTLGEKFEAIVPLDWGGVDPIRLEENNAFPFVYITLGGDVFSEAIIVHSFATEKGQTKIAGFELGRP
ncbi:MAG: hypothetical protein OES90_09545 [Xanthomonadales bacterium]|nr:hypothetical protein [Xanthomonadales bacterium]